jgi:hypothetical protein
MNYPGAQHAIRAESTIPSHTHESLVQIAQNSSDSAWKLCKSRINRLDDLNRMIESCADPFWFKPSEIQDLTEKLQQNRYFPAMRKQFLSVRLFPYETSSELLLCNDSLDSISTILIDAKLCSAEVAGEIDCLRSLEKQSSESITKMLASQDIPLCTEEVKTALFRLKSKFEPSWSTLARTIKKSSAEIPHDSKVIPSRCDFLCSVRAATSGAQHHDQLLQETGRAPISGDYLHSRKLAGPTFRAAMCVTPPSCTQSKRAQPHRCCTNKRNINLGLLRNMGGLPPSPQTRRSRRRPSWCA